MKSIVRKTRSSLTILMMFALILVLAVYTMAYFTDRETVQATATAGTLNLVFTDLSAAIESTGENVQARDQVWLSGKLTVDGGVLNPGDTIDMDYKLSNTGSKSMDVRQQIVLTSSVALTASAEEYSIIIADQTIVPEKSLDNKTLTYALPDMILDGSKEIDRGTASSGAICEQTYEVSLVFAQLAKNEFQGSTVTVRLDIQAKQHRNTSANDFAPWASYESSVEQVN